MADRDVWWRCLAGSAPAQMACGPAAAGLAYWPRLVAVGHARRSQFDALVDVCRGLGAVAEPIAALAVTGEGFHGQRGRPWLAAAGNLHLSIAMPLHLSLERCGAALPVLPAIAVTDALAACLGSALPVRIKWVNDIHVGGAKLGGVVATAQIVGDQVASVVYGIGLNVRVAPPVAPTPFVPRVVCLADAPTARGVALAPSRLLGALLAALARRAAQLTADDGAAALADTYRRRCDVVGRLVALWPDEADGARVAGPLARGTVTDLTSDLALVLDAHPQESFRSGRLEVLDAG